MELASRARRVCMLESVPLLNLDRQVARLLEPSNLRHSQATGPAVPKKRPAANLHYLPRESQVTQSGRNMRWLALEL